jgi:hypothetical protein
MLHFPPCTLNCTAHTNLSYNRSSLYRFHTDNTENTSQVIAISPLYWPSGCIAMSYNIRPLRQFPLLRVGTCLPSRCLATRWLIPLHYESYRQLVGLLGQGQPVAKPLPMQDNTNIEKNAYIHAPSGTRNHGYSVRVRANISCFTLRDTCDRQ